jgi:hypothetical protein
MATVFAICVVIVVAGVVWFHILRPILVDFGVIGVDESVKDNEPTPAVIMSRPEYATPLSTPSSLRTDDGRTETTAPQPRFTEDQLLTLYALLRSSGVTRDRATPALKAAGIPVNNNLWTRAAPPAPADDGEYRTPIAGRPADAALFRESGELAYEPPPTK